MVGFLYSPINQKAIVETPWDGVTVFNSTVLPRGSGLVADVGVYDYADGRKPVGAFLKGALGKASEVFGQGDGSSQTDSVDPNITVDQPQEDPTFMQKYGLWIGGGVGLVVIIAGSIAAYNAFTKKK